MPVYVGFGYGLPKMVKRLLIINAAVFVVTVLFYQMQHVIWYLFGLVPELVTHRFMVWQFFTYMFLHGGFGHILFNMFALWMFGSELEYNWGSRDFLHYYLICGVGGGVLVWITSFFGLSSSGVPTIGASGAIFGVLLAYGMMWPDRPIYIWGILPMKALHLVILYGVINILYGFSGSGGNVAYFAHIGGFATGFIYLKFGWRAMVHVENLGKRWKRRKFTVHDGGRSRRSMRGDGSRDDEAMHPDIADEVDRILDKIAREGMDSLSDRERRILDRASNRRK